MRSTRPSWRSAIRTGFRGKLAIHPDQVPSINRAFSPSADELAHARRIVAAFAVQPDVAAFQIDGRMIDIPHLEMPERILAFHREIESA
jgi:citrate lyase subunit beta/citryl-CoA lyase